MGLNATTLILGSIAIIVLVIGLVVVIKIAKDDPDIRVFIIDLFKVLRGEPRQVPLVHVGSLNRRKGEK